MKIRDIVRNEVIPPVLKEIKKVYPESNRIEYKQNYDIGNISLIIPIFNRPIFFHYLIKYIEQLCQSIQIVVVDASTDENSGIHQKIIENARTKRPTLDIRYHHYL